MESSQQVSEWSAVSKSHQTALSGLMTKNPGISAGVLNFTKNLSPANQSLGNLTRAIEKTCHQINKTRLNKRKGLN